MNAGIWTLDRKTAGRLPYASLVLAVSAILSAHLPAAAAWLQYNRTAIAAGEVWRFLTAHWTHASGDHLFWDVLMFAVLGVPCERESRLRYTVCIAVTAVLIPLALWCTWPAMSTYRGLSGIDSALFALLVASNVKRVQAARQWGWVGALGLMCLAFASKVTYELMTGGTLFVDSHAAQMTPGAASTRHRRRRRGRGWASKATRTAPGFCAV
jgi:rhomboid family GlyGly-CTERM serine protease